MFSTGIDEMRECQLADVPQPLKNLCVDNFHFGFIETDETVDRISYFLHLHRSNPTQ
jgi:hypothetical protein